MMQARCAACGLLHELTEDGWQVSPAVLEDAGDDCLHETMEEAA